MRPSTPSLLAALVLSVSLVQVAAAPASQAQLVLSQVNLDQFPLLESVPTDTNLRVGSSPSMTALSQTLKSEFETAYSGSEIDLAASSSDDAIAALLSGDIDLAAIGRPLTAAEKAQGLVEVPVSREKIAIIVGPSNNIAGDLTFEQFAQIFRGEITDWSAVGGAARPIRLIDRPDTSDTRQALSRYEVFTRAPFETGSTATQLAEDDTAAVAEALGSDGISYAIANHVLNRDGVKIVPMHKTLPDDPRYPYSQPRSYVYKGEPTPAVAAFLGFVISPQGQAAIATARLNEAAAVAEALGETAPGGETAATGSAGQSATAAPEAPAASDPAAAAGASATDPASPDEAVAVAPGASDRAGLPIWLWALLPLALLAALLWGLSRRRGGNAPAAPLAPGGGNGGAGGTAELAVDPAASIPGGISPLAGGAAAAAGAAALPLSDREPNNGQLGDAAAAVEPPATGVSAPPTTDIAGPPAASIDPARPAVPEIPTGAAAAGLAGLGLGAAAMMAAGNQGEADIEPPLAADDMAASDLPEPLTASLSEPPPLEGSAPLTPVEPTVPGAALPSIPAAAPDIDPTLIAAAGTAGLGLGAAAMMAADSERSELAPPEADVLNPAVGPAAVDSLETEAPTAEITAAGEVSPIAPGTLGDELSLAEPATIEPPPAPAASGLPIIAAAGAAGLAAGAASIMVGDEDQSMIEASKYDVVGHSADKVDLSDVDQGLADLPDGYGDSRIVLLPRDPQWAYTYWDAPNEHRDALRSQGGERLALRLYDVTDVDISYQTPHNLQQYDCDELARDWYLPVPVSDRDYLAEIGYLTADGRWLLLARSNPIHIPPVYPSDWIEDQFLTVGWMDDLRGKTLFSLGNPAQAAESGPLSIYENLFGLAQSAESMRVAGSLFGSMQHVPGSIMPGLSLPQQALSSYIFPSGAGLWALPTASGMPNFSGIGLAASMPPVRPRKFWLVADAELIVYGATEPDATVTIGGQPIQLNPDGTFRFHLSFQDGQLDYPIMAVAVDGEQSRSIHMSFERETPERRTNTKEEAQDEWPPA